VLKDHPASQIARLTRRSTLGLLAGACAATSVASSSMRRIARADDAGDDSHGRAYEIPRDLLPGGSYDQFLREQATQDLFSGNVLLAYRGRPVLTRSYGMAFQQKSIPIGPDTIFLLASVTKTMTATAVLQLVASGQLALDDTLGTYLSGFSGTANTITIHQLLTMTSGMADYSQDPAWRPQVSSWTTPDQVLQGTLDIIMQDSNASLQFTPGSAYRYSNSGFVVLGKIVAQVSGQDYWDYMRHNIFAAAGMTRTDFYERPQVAAMLADGRIAHNYASQRGGPRVDLGPSLFIGLPDGAGGPYTTASDLLAFAMALQNGTLLRPDYVRLMLDGKVPAVPLPTPFDPAVQLYLSGYGLTDTLLNDKHILSHAGEGPGVTSNLDIYPTEGWVAIVLENYDLQPFGLIPDASQLVELERRLITQAR
jgi:CubicO group peptidase (beta-lactamase class C family)